MNKQVTKEEMRQKIEEGIINIFTSEKYGEWLKFGSNFHNYSLNNRVLIFSQNPDATMCAGYTTWKKLERNVNAGEKGLTIFGPAEKKYPKLDKDGEPVLDKDGNPEMIKRLYFIPLHVFDVSQTDGKPIPSLVEDLNFDVNDYTETMNKIKDTALSLNRDFVLKSEMAPGVHGYCSPVEVAVKSGYSEAQTIKTAIHECAHAMVDFADSPKYEDGKLDTAQDKEVRAESVAFIICHKLGIDTSDYSFGYLASWAGIEGIKVVEANMDKIDEISKSIDEMLYKEKEPLLCKEITQYYAKDTGEDYKTGEEKYSSKMITDDKYRELGVITSDGDRIPVVIDKKLVDIKEFADDDKVKLLQRTADNNKDKSMSLAM